ncbi:MAG TPA: hypothetical protein VE783_05250, partial [Candidatus Limnocylindrales bacterium]|nr:hypothetical protein [Candidatus Limnocylindrales bacterium]
MNSGPHPDCPEEKVLQEIAAEARPADAYAENVLHHAAQCPHCGPILSQYLAEFSDQPVPELQALNQNEETAWQNALARELANKSRPKSAPPLPERDRNVLRFPVWARITAWAAPIAAVVVMAVFWGPGLYGKYELKKANDLVAADYAKHRTTLMKLPGVPHGDYMPAIHELGSDTNSLGLNRPDLVKANGILADHQNTNSPAWTRVEGRIALLKGAEGLKQAEDAFDRAKAEGMNDPGLEIDLAVTYFERDSRSDNPNLAQTIDLLNHVLKSPKLTAEQRNTALFDLAIAYEKSNMLDMAADTWTEYLKADTNTSGGWYKEAQQHLTDLKKRLPPPRAADFRQPGYLLRHLDDPEVQNDIEQFQDFALAHWLPDAFRNPGSDSARAIHAIADLMEKQHGDTWWRDFLRSTTAEDLPAIEAASAAFLSSENDLHSRALQNAQAAAGMFQKSSNSPGTLMAKFAQVYALQRSLSAQECVKEGASLADSVQEKNYPWLRANVALERAVCATLVSESENTGQFIEIGKSIAKEHSLPELRMRALGLDVSMRTRNGDAGVGWKESVESLGTYFRG